MKLYGSPWGAPDHQKEIAEGIIRIDTPSHGGYWLSPERWAELQSVLPGFKPWAGEQWLEEDCDWSAAVIVWPEHFGGQAVHAILSAIGRVPEAYRALVAAIPEGFWDTEQGRRLKQIQIDWLDEHHEDWELSGYVGSLDRRVIYLRRIGDGATREVQVDNYPWGKRLFTDADIEALEVLHANQS